MIAQVVPVELPSSVYAVAVQNSYGSYTVYENTLHTGAKLEDSGMCDCIQKMYNSLNPENRRMVDDLVDKLLEEQGEAEEIVSKSDTNEQEGL